MIPPKGRHAVSTTTSLTLCAKAFEDSQKNFLKEYECKTGEFITCKGVKVSVLFMQVIDSFKIKNADTLVSLAKERL